MASPESYGSGCCHPRCLNSFLQLCLYGNITVWRIWWVRMWGCNLQVSNEIHIYSCYSCFLTAINIYLQLCWCLLCHKSFAMLLGSDVLFVSFQILMFLFAHWNGVRWTEMKWNEMKWVKCMKIVSSSHPLLRFCW